MDRILLVLFLLIATSTTAQYRGGSNDGFALTKMLAQNPISNVYSGGANDGFAIIGNLNQNPVQPIYTGGPNDGFAQVVNPNQNPVANIYSGGANDGFDHITIINQNPVAGIYTGGINDGFSVLQLINQNPVANIYVGGVNDGFAFVTENNLNPIAVLIYHGGADDGFDVVSSLHQNLTDPLPVELLHFSGEWFNDDALLEWQTGEEHNLDHFELERSGDIGINFSVIASIAPNTANGVQHDYRYTDVRAWYLPSDVLFYRLKCIDKSGKFKYSAIARLSKDKTQPVIVVYPNPTSGHFTLAMLNVKDIAGYEYLLTGVDGRMIQRGVIREANTSFDLSNLAASTYHLVLTKDGKPVNHFTILLTQ